MKSLPKGRLFFEWTVDSGQLKGELTMDNCCACGALDTAAAAARAAGRDALPWLPP